jgi:hypothetical protein
VAVSRVKGFAANGFWGVGGGGLQQVIKFKQHMQIEKKASNARYSLREFSLIRSLKWTSSKDFCCFVHKLPMDICNFCIQNCKLTHPNWFLQTS